jgi:DNA-directed RNA polymerase specialized sigma24 family protein
VSAGCGSATSGWASSGLRRTTSHRRPDEIVAAVRALAPARREVIVLHYWLDLAVDEIAALLGLTLRNRRVASQPARSPTCAYRSRANVS